MVFAFYVYFTTYIHEQFSSIYWIIAQQSNQINEPALRKSMLFSPEA